MQLLTVQYDSDWSTDLGRGLRICSDAVERDLWTMELVTISILIFRRNFQMSQNLTSNLLAVSLRHDSVGPTEW